MIAGDAGLEDIVTAESDVIVVGSGFAGLSAALQLVRARRSVVLLDGGRPRNRYAAQAHGLLGHDGKPPAQIKAEALAQLDSYPTIRRLSAQVVRATGTKDAFTIHLQDGSTLSARRLLLAGGVRDRLPSLPGLEARWGVSVLHCPYCHGYEVADRSLGVLASHPHSFHQAALLPDWGATTWFTQGLVTPDAAQAELLRDRGVRIETTPVTEILGDAPYMSGLRLADGREVVIQALFVGAGSDLVDDLPRQLGCRCEDDPLGQVIVVDETMQTSVPGVFAAGDATRLFSNASFALAAGVAAGIGLHRSLVFPE